jgi:hypothetical protein
LLRGHNFWHPSPERRLKQKIYFLFMRYTPTHVEDEKVIAKLRFMDSSWGHDSRRLFVC